MKHPVYSKHCTRNALFTSVSGMSLTGKFSMNIWKYQFTTKLVILYVYRHKLLNAINQYHAIYELGGSSECLKLNLNKCTALGSYVWEPCGSPRVITMSQP